MAGHSDASCPPRNSPILQSWIVISRAGLTRIPSVCVCDMGYWVQMAVLNEEAHADLTAMALKDQVQGGQGTEGPGAGGPGH